jgi:hypothetical protein
MNPLPESVEKYLQKYSLGNWVLESNDQNEIDNVIVIPVISEYDNLRKLLSSLLKNNNKYFNKTAVITVVNNFHDSSEEIKLDNKKSLNFLRAIISKSSSEDSLISEIKKSNLNINLIDASSMGFEMPSKIGGVGLARKIGMDAALKIFNYKSDSKKILICLDADCTTDSKYLTTIVNEFTNRNLSAATVNFQHNIEEDLITAPAIICYEIFLHYYVLGLKYACSPFAFHTVGSTIICDFESYIKVEGMNKRKAAEDFYFLEKLAKNYRIEKINSTAVYPSSRSSWRVPFGTGQRVGRFLSNRQHEYLLYDPVCFVILKAWLEVFNTNEINTSAEYLNFAEKIHPELSNFLIQQKFENDWNKILKNSTKPEQLAKQKHKWFDGFKTLKLIHYLRDKSFPQIAMFEALNGMLSRLEVTKDFYWHKKDIPDIETQKKYLELLRELT